MILPRRQVARRWDLPDRNGFRLWPRLSAPQTFLGSFLLLIVLGTVGFKALPGLYAAGKEPLSWTDAAFTTTSAVCVTGLVVVDTATHFTFAGQAYVLALIQVGGLGMIAFASVIITALGRRLSLHQEELSLPAVSVAAEISPRRLVRDVVLFTFAIEAAGAALLYLCWLPDLGFTGAAWPAVFHAVSGFCNAGFSTFSDSLISYQRSPGVLLVVAAMVVLGGLGFLTLEELVQWLRSWRRGRAYRLSLHSRIALTATAHLLLLGTALFLWTEWDATLRELPLGHRVTNAFFLAVTPRTAGFNNVDYTQAAESTCFVTVVLMMIGGSPGSTAGGMKTTTMALLGVVAWSRLRGERSVTLWDRSLRDETINRTIGLVVVAIMVVLAGVFLLSVTEAGEADGRERFLEHTFEVVSAFNTVGLSMNYSPELSGAGRWLMIALMFLGRVGPLTFAAALAVRYARASRFRYAYEDVVVG